MKTFKLIDFWGQVILIAGSVLSLAIDAEIAFWGYFFAGGWQVLSCIAHGLLQERYFAAKDRKYYLKTLIWVFIIGITLIPVWVIYGFGLLFVSPVLAIWYAMICHNENELLEHKSLVHLK